MTSMQKIKPPKSCLQKIKTYIECYLVCGHKVSHQPNTHKKKSRSLSHQGRKRLIGYLQRIIAIQPQKLTPRSMSMAQEQE